MYYGWAIFTIQYFILHIIILIILFFSIGIEVLLCKFTKIKIKELKLPSFILKNHSVLFNIGLFLVILPLILILIAYIYFSYFYH